MRALNERAPAARSGRSMSSDADILALTETCPKRARTLSITATRSPN
jgi:hypothetical protein